ncbi:hypothetical protein Sango_0934600 [Sesamum angolense]|uniref:Protein RETICULATA-RELATED 1, chloroplastic n=1 Tax=Sesamum angolense TaxID=2727404 RepID=A0AAE1WZ47_9LAMI|nr:hypothetical protein Sango_0934600 [Sesamum angolense]
MSHSVFQTAQIMPLAPTPNSLSSKSLLPTTIIFRSTVSPAVAGKLRRCCFTVKASSSAVVDDDAIASLERCFQASPPAADAPSSTSSSSADFGPVMKGKYGAFGAVTLEKSKLDLTQKQTKSSPELSTGGGGGNIGKGLSHGGGDGGDDGGDDDDYFDDFDEGDEGDEGLESDVKLAPGFGQLCPNGEVSGNQCQTYDREVHFSVSSPGTVKSIYWEMFLALDSGRSSHSLAFLNLMCFPCAICVVTISGDWEMVKSLRSKESIYERVIVREDDMGMIADPAFLYRLLLEQATTIGCSVWWEIKNRKERIKQEWDLALINVLTVTACNAIVVWSLAPCRSYGNTFQFDLQNTLQKLPNNIFEKSYPFREFDFQKRLQSFFYKAAELCMVGFTAGAAQGAISNLAASKKEGRLSVTVPSVSTNALGYGAFLGLYANLRYQLLCGFDRAVTSYFDVIGVALFFSTALRVLNVQLGETSRLAWLGVEVDPLAQSDDLLKAAYNRPSEGANESSSKWFISKNAIVSGLGLLGIRQGRTDSNTEGEAPPPKARRKRIVRRKVATS